MDGLPRRPAGRSDDHSARQPHQDHAEPGVLHVLCGGLLAAVAFWQEITLPWWWERCSIHISFVLDCVDGKIARLKGTGSVFGMWLDYSFDRYRVLACTGALMYGQYQRSGEVYFIWLAVLVTFLDMLRYMDALQVYKLRLEMGRRLGGAASEISHGVALPVSAHEAVRFLPVGAAQDLGYHRVPTASSSEAVVYAGTNVLAQAARIDLRPATGVLVALRLVGAGA